MMITSCWSGIWIRPQHSQSTSLSLLRFRPPRSAREGLVCRGGGNSLSRPVLSDDVHIWRAFLDRSGPEIASLERVLSADERARARDYHFDRDRCRYIAGRGLLRMIL